MGGILGAQGFLQSQRARLMTIAESVGPGKANGRAEWAQTRTSWVSTSEQSVVPCISGR
jgi:hypothetical protein